ncbi:MAG TPA: tetratricopeptide repeat protein, partial [Wenzhouxiangella sp.]
MIQTQGLFGSLIVLLVLVGTMGPSARVLAQSDPTPPPVSEAAPLEPQVDPSMNGREGLSDADASNNESVDSASDSPTDASSDASVSADFFQQASDPAIIAWLQERVAVGGAVLTEAQAEALMVWVGQATQRLSVEQAAEVYFDAGRLIYPLGPDERALELLLRAAQLTDAGNTLANIQRWVGDVHRVTGAFEPAVEAYLVGLQVADGGDAVEVELLLSLGDVSRRLGETNRALRYLEQAQTIAQDRGLIEPLTRVILVQAAVNRAMDANEQALAIYEQGLALALGLDDPVLLGMFYNNIGNVLRDMGQLDESLAFFDRALAISESEDKAYGVGINHINQAVVYYLKGEYERSVAKYDLAEAILNDMDRPYEQRSVYEGFAYAYQALGEYEQAFAALMRFNELNSQVLNKEIQVAAEEMQTRYETLLKDSELALQAAEIREQEQTLQTAVVVIVALLVIVGGLVGFMRYRNHKFRVLYQRNKELMLANARARQARQASRLLPDSSPGSVALDESML